MVDRQTHPITFAYQRFEGCFALPMESLLQFRVCGTIAVRDGSTKTGLHCLRLPRRWADRGHEMYYISTSKIMAIIKCLLWVRRLLCIQLWVSSWLKRRLANLKWIKPPPGTWCRTTAITVYRISKNSHTCGGACECLGHAWVFHAYMLVSNVKAKWHFSKHICWQLPRWQQTVDVLNRSRQQTCGPSCPVDVGDKRHWRSWKAISSVVSFLPTSLDIEPRGWINQFVNDMHHSSTHRSCFEVTAAYSARWVVVLHIFKWLTCWRCRLSPSWSWFD